MALTNKLGIVADCFPNPNGELYLDRLTSANNELFERIRTSRRFPIRGNVRMLDVGSGDMSSEFVNRYSIEFPNTEIVYLDSANFLLKELNKPNKVCADATNMPFLDNSFDIAYAGHIISGGIIKEQFHFKDESYKIAKESYRVLKKDGFFIFTYCMGDDTQTLTNLGEIGFKDLEHLQRIKWYGGIPTDTYLVRK